MSFDAPIADAWKWLKTAPLPVVLASCITGVGISITYASNVSGDATKTAQEAKDRAAEAKNDAVTAKTDAARSEQAVKEIGQKIDQLIAAVGELKGEVRASRRKPNE